MILIETINYDQQILILSTSKTVKYLALIDIIFAFLTVLLNPYLIIMAIICVGAGLCGYYGAKNYNKSHTLCYVLFLLLQNIFRPIVFITYWVNPSIFGMESVEFETIFFNAIILLLHVYINYYIYTFYCLLKVYSHEALTSLNIEPQLVIVHGSLV